jgi:hypothetical protein
VIDCVPLFRRGFGFGNRLFSWARAEVYARRHALRMVSPVWVYPRWRPLYLGGVSTSDYLNQIVLFGVFRRHPAEAGLARLTRDLLVGHRLPEPEDLTVSPPEGVPAAYIAFREMGGVYHSFQQLAGEETFLYQRLTEITRQRWLSTVRGLSHFARNAIGLNVRRGKDFRDAKRPADWLCQGGLRTPLRWFIDMLRYVRERVGQDTPALLVSDGSPDDLQPLLACGNVTFARPGCAASDLLLLSKTKVLIGSGGSSFSAWASYFGRMPTITHPGSSLSWFGLPVVSQHLVTTLDPVNPDVATAAEFRAALRCQISGAVPANK